MQIRKLAVLVGLYSLSSIASANVIQAFFANNYTNPADISRINDFQLKVGANWGTIHDTYKGQVFGVNGSASSNEEVVYPFFLIAKRLNPQITIGLNVSNPYIGDLEFAANSIVAPATTNTIVHDVDFNPMISYKVNDKLVFGAGLIFNDFSQLELDYVSAISGNVVNKTSAWSYGFDLGLNYAISQQTFFGFAYFSKLVPHFHGTSVAGTLEKTNAKFVGFILPATTKLELTHFFSPKWMTDFSLFFSQWSDSADARAVNVFPFNLNFPIAFRNTFDVALYNRYTLNDKWDVSGLLIFDEGAARNRTVTINFPAYNTYIIKAGAIYHLRKESEIKLQAGYIFSNPHVNHPFGFNMQGSERLRLVTLETEFTYNI